MIRLRFLAFIFLGLILAVAAAWPQNPPVEEQWRALNADLSGAYEKKSWSASLAVLDRMMKLAEETRNGEAKAAIFYMSGCVQALAGDKLPALVSLRRAFEAGFKDYEKFRSDTDLNSLRDEPEFVALLAEVKSKYGPATLLWVRDASAPEFEVRFDDPADSRFAEMRREFEIDAAVSGAQDGLERLRRLARWVSSRWAHSSTQMASKADPVTILREAQKGGRFICRDYAIVMAGVATAFGWPARIIGLLPRDVETGSEAHSVAEVWLEEFHKWVLADGQYGAIGELDGAPLSAVELQAALVADRPVVCSAGEAVLAEWKPFLLRNAFYFKMADDQRAFEHRIQRQLVLVPRGAAQPTKFAGGNEAVFSGAIYTSNPASFYAPPPRRER